MRQCATRKTAQPCAASLVDVQQAHVTSSDELPNTSSPTRAHHDTADLKLENILVTATAVQTAQGAPSLAGVDCTTGAAKVDDGVSAAPAVLHTIKLADFGSARHLDGAAASTGAMSFVGSPQYVAPEVLFTHVTTAGDAATAHGYGHPVDVYSVGVVAYACLAGHLPFDAVASGSSTGRVPSSWEARARAGELHFLSPPWARVSGEAKDLIRGMMAVDPRMRLTVACAQAHTWFAPVRG